MSDPVDPRPIVRSSSGRSAPTRSAATASIRAMAPSRRSVQEAHTSAARLLRTALAAFAIAAAGAAPGQTPGGDRPAASDAASDTVADARRDVASAEPADATAAPTPRRSTDFTSDVARRQRFGAAAFEIVAFDTLLNQANRRWSGVDDYDSNIGTIHRNLRSHWGVDDDPFRINQLGHPYQGSIYHGIARSSGLDYWESAAYTFAGSVLWEIAGEKTRPSANDQVASGIGGSFLGEALFRMANLVLERGGGPRLWRELRAAAISPPTGFNRLAYGDDREPIFGSGGADVYSRVQLGATRAVVDHDAGNGAPVRRNDAVAEFAIDYGLPGQPGYDYRAPFDYFAFRAATSTSASVESVVTRGSLFVRSLPDGERLRGIVGLYGGYDFLAPPTFRVSSTSLSFGTTFQWNATGDLTLQGTALGGVGYAAVGSVHTTNDRDYQYGVTPQTTIAWRAIVGNLWSLDVEAHDWFVSHVGSDAGGVGHGNVGRIEASLTRRIAGPHAVTVKYLGNFRDTTFGSAPTQRQSRSTIGLFYTYLGHDRFGATRF